VYKLSEEFCKTVSSQILKRNTLCYYHLKEVNETCVKQEIRVHIQGAYKFYIQGVYKKSEEICKTISSQILKRNTLCYYHLKEVNETCVKQEIRVHIQGAYKFYIQGVYKKSEEFCKTISSQILKRNTLCYYHLKEVNETCVKQEIRVHIQGAYKFYIQGVYKLSEEFCKTISSQILNRNTWCYYRLKEECLQFHSDLKWIRCASLVWHGRCPGDTPHFLPNPLKHHYYY